MAESFIDRVFRGYGEQFFGKEAMDLISSTEVEDARCKAMQVLNLRTMMYGKQRPHTAEQLFCKYISEKLSEKDGKAAVVEWWNIKLEKEVRLNEP